METIANLMRHLRARPAAEPEEGESEQRKAEVLDRLARAIVARRLEAPAVLFLELNRPLGFLFSQAAFFARPFLSFFLPVRDVEAAAEALDDREALDHLLDRIHELSAGEPARGKP